MTKNITEVSLENAVLNTLLDLSLESMAAVTNNFPAIACEAPLQKENTSDMSSGIFTTFWGVANYVVELLTPLAETICHYLREDLGHYDITHQQYDDIAIGISATDILGTFVEMAI